jgi:hypothetical protein
VGGQIRLGALLLFGVAGSSVRRLDPWCYGRVTVGRCGRRPMRARFNRVAPLTSFLEAEMLMYVEWKPRAGNGPKESEAALETFTRWSPPAGMEIKGMWARADGGGFCLCEVDSAEAALEATGPWVDAYLDYYMAPVVEIEKAVEVMQKAIAFRNG